MRGEPVDPDDEAERAKAAERRLGGRDLCRAVRCKRKVGAYVLFCAKHWRAVPGRLKAALGKDPDDASALSETVVEVRRIELERPDR